MSADRDCVLIVGAGQAGCDLALGLRQQGWAGRIVLLGAESRPPYQRPPLSKGFLKGQVEESSLRLRQPAAYERSGIEVVTNARVERIERDSKTLLLADGTEHRYSKLAIATGGRPRRLPIHSGRAERAANVHYLRTIDDVLAIRERFLAGRRVVILGGGYIGLEVAASAIAQGLEVTVLEALPRVLARVAAPELSQFYEGVHRTAGVDLRTGIGAVGFEMAPAGDAVAAVHLSDGSEVPADLVVIGIGIEPNTELAQQAGLAVDNGIVVDDCSRTTDPDIVAAGDCTSRHWANAGCNVRVESVPNAVEQARAAAATLAGKPRPNEAVPWFWSDQYDLKLQIAGLCVGCDQRVVRGSMASRSFTLFSLREGRLIACDAVNRPQDFLAAKRLIAARAELDPARLADEALTLGA